MGTALVTDLYELTMAQSLLEQGKTGQAVFSLFVRSLPKERNFLVACGLETLIRQLEEFRFSSDEVAYLAELRVFSDDFLDWLKAYRFSGDLSAIMEGSIVFQNEPLIQIEGILPEVQIIETLVLNSIQYQTMAASKAARIIAASEGRTVVDFGFRRAHMADAGICAARAGYIAGFSATSNLDAGKRFGIPVVGTMAHSYIMAFTHEAEAFRAFSTTFPDRAIFLIDTYDTLACAETVAALARQGVPVLGVRLDSGDMKTLVPAVRKTLDDAGLNGVKIVVSSGVDEYSIAAWLQAGVPIDSFGVGTHFVTSSDAPFLDMVYKLVEYEGSPVCKTSPGKATFAGRRQVIRHYAGRAMSYDELVRIRHGTARVPGLLQEVMNNGKCICSLPSLERIRDHMAAELSVLPEKFRSLDKRDYRVVIEP